MKPPVTENNEKSSKLSVMVFNELQVSNAKRDRLRFFAYYSAKSKWRRTYICTMVTWRLIQLGISLWQVGDMVSDAFQTRKFYHLAMVRENNTIKKYFKMQLTIPTVYARGQRIELLS